MSATMVKKPSRYAVALIAFVALIGFVSSPSFAGPIPVLPTPVPSAGESLLTSFIVGPASSVNIDWQVISTTGTAFSPTGVYAYLYQLENTSGIAVDTFTITLAPGTASSIIASGVLAADNLDLATAFHPAHAVGTYPILATEADPFPLASLAGVTTTLDTINSNITWTFSPFATGFQSDTMYFLSTLPPTYGNAGALDSIPPSPWGSPAPGGQPVPIPIPEPSTLVLLSLGLVGLLLHRRRSS